MLNPNSISQKEMQLRQVLDILNSREQSNPMMNEEGLLSENSQTTLSEKESSQRQSPKSGILGISLKVLGVVLVVGFVVFILRLFLGREKSDVDYSSLFK
jgi:hypothetical protein